MPKFVANRDAVLRKATYDDGSRVKPWERPMPVPDPTVRPEPVVELTRAITLLQQSLEKPPVEPAEPKKPERWTFTIERDAEGRMARVIAKETTD